MNYIAKVEEFHRLFDHPVLNKPTVPHIERAKLRIALLQEELNELNAAIDAGNIVDAADALCDLQYVLSGTVLEFGLANHFNSLFNEVQRSNMSKACNTEEEAIATIGMFPEDQDQYDYKEKDGKWLVYRNDGKTIKSINYSQADLKSILNHG